MIRPITILKVINSKSLIKNIAIMIEVTKITSSDTTKTSKIIRSVITRSEITKNETTKKKITKKGITRSVTTRKEILKNGTTMRGKIYLLTTKIGKLKIEVTTIKPIKNIMMETTMPKENNRTKFVTIGITTTKENRMMNVRIKINLIPISIKEIAIEVKIIKEREMRTNHTTTGIRDNSNNSTEYQTEASTLLLKILPGREPTAETRITMTTNTLAMEIGGIRRRIDFRTISKNINTLIKMRNGSNIRTS